MNPLFTIRAVLIGAAIASTSGFAAGWKVAAWKYGGEEAKLLLHDERLHSAALEDNLRQIREVLLADGKSAAIDLRKSEELNKHAQDIIRAASDRPAFSADTVDGLRTLFDKSK